MQGHTSGAGLIELFKCENKYIFTGVEECKLTCYGDYDNKSLLLCLLLIYVDNG